MKHLFIALILLVGTILGALPDRLRARDEDKVPIRYVLYRVASGDAFPGGKSKSPSLIEADPSGGRIVVQIKHSDDCSEKVEFTWKFNTDIIRLKTGQEFAIALAGKVSGDCKSGEDPTAQQDNGIIEPSITKRLKPEEIKGLEGMAFAPPVRIGFDFPMAIRRDGQKESRWKAESRQNLFASGVWHGVRFRAISPRGEAFEWQVVYCYRAETKSTPPGDVTITLDNPPKGSSTTITIGPGGVPPTPGTQPGGDPATDPALQACIERWLDKMISILNRNAPDRAPWSISRYGHLVNRLVRSVAPPEGWETTYRSNKYVFIWQVYGRAHLDPLLRGELPALHSECGGGAGTTPGGAGTTPGGTGTTPGGTGTTSGGTGTTPGGGTLPVPPGGTVSTKRTLLAESRVTSPKQTVTVPVRLLKPAGVANVNFEVAYNPAVVSVRSVTRGSLLSGTGLFEANPNEPGRIRIGFAEKSGWSADGIVANLTFEVTGKPGDRTPLTLKVTDIDDANGNPLPIDLVHGEIVVSGPGSRVPGDCDGDGLVTAADALCALKMSVGLRPVVMTMDVTGDQQVTSADARKILQQIP